MNALRPWKENDCIYIKCKDFFFYLFQDGFVVRIFATSTEPVLQQELQLKLARKCLHACGISLFDLEKDLHIISKSSSLKVDNKLEIKIIILKNYPSLCLPLLCAGMYSFIINTWRSTKVLKLLKHNPYTNFEPYCCL